MFTCYTHGWNSHQYMCPLCQQQYSYTSSEVSTSDDSVNVSTTATNPKPKMRVWAASDSCLLRFSANRPNYVDQEPLDITAELAEALKPYLEGE